MGFLSGATGGQNTFRAQAATGNTQYTGQDLLPAIAQGQGGFQNQLQQLQGIGGAQGQLANLLLAQSQGAGPNIAQEQLQQATNRNIEQGAGMIASQRGMNPALAARLVANQTARANQEAAGQSGLMRAQQQLATQGLLGNTYGQQAQTAASGGQLANQNLGINQSALQGQNQQVVGAKENADAINAKIESENAAARAKAAGGLLGGLGSVAGTLLSGGGIGAALTGAFAPPKEGKYAGGEIDYRDGGHVPGEAPVEGNDIKNDIVDAKLSPGEVVLPRSVTKSADAPDRAKEFMEAILKEKSSEPKGYSKILEMKRRMEEAHSHLDELHKMLTKKNA